MYEKGPKFAVRGAESIRSLTELYNWTELDGSYNTTFGILADVDSSGKVDMRDISLVARSFQDPDFDSCYDLTGDGKLDLRDIAVAAQHFGKGIFSIDIYGDASGLYMMCDMFRQFNAMKIKWSTSLPSYPSGYMEINLDARDLSLEEVNDWSYHFGTKGLEDGSMVSTGYESYIFSVQARSGELDFIFYDRDSNYPGYYHTADIVGTLKGDVHFHLDLPDIQGFHYEGRELAIHVHIGTR